MSVFTIARAAGSALGAIIVLLATPAQADWLQCSGCSDAARRQAALQLPPDRFGVTTVNVLDNLAGDSSSFRVQVFYDYEFRSYLRFAQPVAADATAAGEFDAWRRFRSALAALANTGLPVGVESAAAFLKLPVTHAAVSSVVDATGLSGLLSATGALAPFAIAPADRLMLRFADNSTAQLSLSSEASGVGLSWRYRAESSAAPNGDPLPDTIERLRQLDRVGDGGSTAYLAGHIYNVWQFRVFVRDVLNASRRYRLRCDDDDPLETGCSAILVG